MRELIGGDLCELARDGSSDAANRGGERDRRLPSCRATLYLKTGRTEALGVTRLFFGGFSLTQKQEKKKKKKHGYSQQRSTPVWHLSKMIPSRSKPLHYSLTSLLS